MISNVDASAFNYSNEIYETTFKEILKGVIQCYSMMIGDGVRVPRNDENGIRDILYSEYLRKRDIRQKTGLIEFRIDIETQEDHSNGRVDLRFFSRNDFENYDAIYIIECKRLNNQNTAGITGYNAKYIQHGILRFVTDHYSSYYNLNGMIGFVVEQMDISDNIEKINELLRNRFPQANTDNYLVTVNLLEDFQFSYYSTHNSNSKKIKLFHLMLDFSNNLEEEI